LSAPIQCALPAWLSERPTLQGQIRERLRENLGRLDAILLRQRVVSRLTVEAGWFAVLRVPGLQPQEDTALDLLLERGVVVHSGGFFGFTGQGWLVVSLLTPLEEFREGVEAIVEHFAEQFNGH
jgi:alanine-synthesizing transaminase